ncbi:hypothetical protein L2I57_019570 [Tychonema sp. BBK16]
MKQDGSGFSDADRIYLDSTATYIDAWHILSVSIDQNYLPNWELSNIFLITLHILTSLEVKKIPISTVVFTRENPIIFSGKNSYSLYQNCRRTEAMPPNQRLKFS